jgi:tetratricopeptide (TPR) repeat protein
VNEDASTGASDLAARSCEDAHAFHREGRLREAEARYRAALESDPGHTGAALGLAYLLNRQGRPGEAVVMLRRALAQAPHADLYDTLGQALAALQRLDDALAAWRAAAALDPLHVAARNNLGSLLLTLHRPADAEAAFREALALAAGDAALRNNLGNALAAQGRHAEAVTHYEAAVVLAPDLAEAHNNLGLARQALGEPERALASFERARMLRPDYAMAHGNAGAALAALGRHADALAAFRRVVELAPQAAEAHNEIGNALAALGRYRDALPAFRQALALNPALAEAHNNLANALAALDQHAEAVPHYRQALALQPAFAEACSNLGVALAALGNGEEAIAQCSRSVALAPDDSKLRVNFASALVKLKRHEEALQHFDAAIALSPDDAHAHHDHGVALEALNRSAEALASFERALAIAPDFADARNSLGQSLTTLGRLAAGRQAFARAAELAPRRADFHRNLALATPTRVGDAHLAAMEDLLRDIDSLEARQQLELHFALGKAYADLGDHARAFAHWRDGNALKRGLLAYPEAEMLAWFERIRAVFTSELMRARQGAGDPSEVPIFIVGMPRSGTTLVEQVLASHPQVFGAGELHNFGRAITDLGGTQAAEAYPDIVPAWTPAQLGRLGARYMDELRAMAPDAPRITDKLPANFQYVGLIHLALPRARIVHVGRDPVDTCVSCFSKLFAVDNLPFSYDLGELGRYYRAYATLMQHWRAVLPPGTMLELQYEDLVADFEPQARRLLAHCGLDWDPRCLAFHELDRPVRTASAAQVRQPLYAGSVARHQNYGGMLRPLMEALR